MSGRFRTLSQAVGALVREQTASGGGAAAPAAPAASFASAQLGTSQPFQSQLAGVADDVFRWGISVWGNAQITGKAAPDSSAAPGDPGQPQ